MTINHPHMTPTWFDQAVHRAMCAGCRVIETKRPGVFFVTSGSVHNLTYRVTRTECSCAGHYYSGRCLHRALACAYADVFRPAEKAAQTPQEAA